MTGFRIFFSVFMMTAMLAGAAAAQAPPVFQDAVDDGSEVSASPPAVPAQAVEGAAPEEAAADAAGEAAPDDPCAAYMEDYNGYVYCKDMYQKIDRMKKGATKRQESYRPKPPPEEKTKTAEAAKDDKKTEEAKPGDKKTEEGKDAEKKDGEKPEEKADARETGKESDASGAGSGEKSGEDGAKE